MNTTALRIKHFKLLIDIYYSMNYNKLESKVTRHLALKSNKHVQILKFLNLRIKILLAVGKKLLQKSCWSNVVILSWGGTMPGIVWKSVEPFLFVCLFLLVSGWSHFYISQWLGEHYWKLGGRNKGCYTCYNAPRFVPSQMPM